MSEKKAAPDAGAARAEFATREISVEGHKVTAADALLIVEDLDEGMRTVTGSISWWGKVWASAEAEAIEADAAYRHYRAKQVIAIGGADKGGPPEYKVMASIEADVRFVALKKALADAQRNVRTAATQFQAFCIKAQQMQSLGANLREESASGRRDTTRTRPTRVVDSGADEAEAESEAPAAPIPKDKIEGGIKKMREASAKRGKISKKEEE